MLLFGEIDVGASVRGGVSCSHVAQSPNSDPRDSIVTHVATGK